MRSTAWRTLGVFALGLTVASCGGDEESSAPSQPPRAEIAPADLVFVGGVVRTGVAEAPTAEAVAVRDGEIVYVGAEADIAPYVVDGTTQSIDLRGAAMFPGFVDGHAHLMGIGRRERTLNLAGVGSIAELVDLVERHAARAPEDGVVAGRGWLEAEWPEGRFPTRDDLDPVSQDVPVALIRADGHAMLLNSAALTRAGLDESVEDPAGGRFERFEDGRLTGLLIDGAMGRAAELVAEPEGAARDDALAAGAVVYAGRGWTGLHNMSVRPDDVERLERLSDEGVIEIRVYNAVDAAGAEALFAFGPRASASGRIVTRAVKLYMDGALGSRGAALSAPYADAPGTSGLMLLEEGEAREIFARALETDIQLAVHAIGDRANHLALDWMEETFSIDPLAAANARWRVEHAQILNPDDISRFDALEVIASMQPSHFATDQFFAPARLGPGRLAGAYAWAAILDEGGVIVGGSDAPVERGDPALEFHAAVARAAADGRRAEGFDGDQAVARDQALAMFTSAPAYAAFEEDALGTIEVGKRADFTVFSADLMTIPLDEIPDVSAVMTVVDGDIVYWASGGR